MQKKTKKRLSLTEKAEKAFREAVNEVVKENIRLGLPLVVWQNNKVTKIPPSELKKMLKDKEKK
ncbi:MAG: hypothetical protein HY391_00040 [Deltaproteobacteria bacterium]|nr:hypothetical protein [Deltaproteobacteria bacterium]